MGNLRLNKVKYLTPVTQLESGALEFKLGSGQHHGPAPPPPRTAAVLREGSSITEARESRAKNSTLSLLAKAPLNMECSSLTTCIATSLVFSQLSPFPRGFT